MHDQKITELGPAEEGARHKEKQPYEAPELTQFGPMRDLTNFDPGPTEDFILYGGAS